MDVLRVADRIGMQRVAIRRGTRHIGCANGAGSAGAVFDDNRLTDLFPQQGCGKTRGHVGQAARRERHHHGDGAVRIILRLSPGGDSRCKTDPDPAQPSQRKFHRFAPPVIPELR